MNKIKPTLVILTLIMVAAFFDLSAAGNRTTLQRTSAASVPSHEVELAKMERAFLTPPDESRVGTFWDWMGGQISREGITKDLEAMTAQGVGKVLVMVMPDQLVVSTSKDISQLMG